MSKVSRLKKIVRFSNVMRIGSVALIVALLISYLTPLIHPQHLWILPFFGLAYPILVFLSFIVILYWAFLRSAKWSITLLLLVVAGYPYFLRLFAYGESVKLP